MKELQEYKENFALAEERRAEAVQNENQALLNFVKAAKELEGIDISHIQELLEMQGIIKAQEAENHVEERSTSKEATPEEKKAETEKLMQQPAQPQNQPEQALQQPQNQLGV